MSSDNENGKLLDHEYDGIQELDNNLPLWWLWTFFGAIIFAFIYWIHYSLDGGGLSLDQELKISMAKIEQQRKQSQESPGEGEKEPSKEELLAMGGELFKANCASCHRNDGGGTIGPNLTDEFWIHGNSEESLEKVIKKGVLAKGMPPWEAILRPNQLKSIILYVKNMENTRVKNGKAPQGEKVN